MRSRIESLIRFNDLPFNSERRETLRWHSPNGERYVSNLNYMLLDASSAMLNFTKCQVFNSCAGNLNFRSYFDWVPLLKLWDKGKWWTLTTQE